MKSSWQMMSQTSFFGISLISFISWLLAEISGMWLENSPWNAILYPLGESTCFIFLTSEYWLVGEEGKKRDIQPLSSDSGTFPCIPHVCCFLWTKALWSTIWRKCWPLHRTFALPSKGKSSSGVLALLPCLSFSEIRLHDALWGRWSCGPVLFSLAFLDHLCDRDRI